MSLITLDSELCSWFESSFSPWQLTRMQRLDLAWSEISLCTIRRVDRKLKKKVDQEKFHKCFSWTNLWNRRVFRSMDISRSVASRFSSLTIWGFHPSWWLSSCDSYYAETCDVQKMWMAEILDSFHLPFVEAESTEKTLNESLITQCLFDRIPSQD